MKGTVAMSWCILVALGTVSCQEFEKKFNESQLAAFRSTLKILLKIEPSDDVNQTGKLPKHMKELYEKYSAEKMTAGDTIRSFEPLKDFVPHIKDVLVYNMSSISKFEKVKSAQLHIFRRRLMPQKGDSRKRLLPPPCRVRLYQLLTTPGPSSSFQPLSTGNTAEVDMRELSETERTKLRSLDTIPVAQMTRGGWYTIEISMALKEMLNSPGATSNLIFGVRFEGPRGKSITPQHFLKEPSVNSSSSYIITFSEDLSPLGGLHQKLTDKEIGIMVELLEKSAYDSEVKENKPRNLVDGMNRKNRHGTKKSRKIDNSDDEVDAIRHGKKHYMTNQKRKNKKNREHSPFTSDGDITELVNFENVKRAIALRRHNHKSVNSLNLRYDSNTKSIIQKKNEKSYEDSEESPLNRTRRVRSIHDNSVSDYVIEFVEEEEDKAKKEPNKTENEEYEKEDDMGDLSYYEPVELETIRPYRHKFHKANTYGEYGRKKGAHKKLIDFDKNNNLVLKDDDDDVKNTKLPFENEHDEISGSGSYEIDSNNDNDNDGSKAWEDLGPFGTTETIFTSTDGKINVKGDKRRHKNRQGLNRRKTKKTKLSYAAKNRNKQKNKECGLSELRINFDEIMVTNVIAPTSFSFSICSGKCRKEFPTRADDYSNHAIFQHMLHQSSDYHDDVPEPCCVPTNMTSIPVLYMMDGNVVLKMFKNIEARSCGCR